MAEVKNQGGARPLINGFRDKTINKKIEQQQEKSSQQIIDERLAKLEKDANNINNVLNELRGERVEFDATFEALFTKLNLDKAEMSKMVDDIIQKRVAEMVIEAKKQELATDEAAGLKESFDENTIVKADDIVYMTFVGYLISTNEAGEKVRTQVPSATSSKPIVIDMTQAMLVKDLQSGLIGMKMNAMKSVAVMMPITYPNKDLAGKDMEFDTTVVRIKERVKKDEAKEDSKN